MRGRRHAGEVSALAGIATRRYEGVVSQRLIFNAWRRCISIAAVGGPLFLVAAIVIERRKKLVEKYASKYEKLKALANDESKDETERLIARLKMAELPRNGNPTRIRNRCELTGRSRAYYRKFRLSRIMLRELANKGLIPGVTKSSW